MVGLTIFCVIGLMLLLGFLFLLHTNMQSEYQMISRFPVPPDLELAVKIVNGIFVFFYIIIVFAVFLLTAT